MPFQRAIIQWKQSKTLYCPMLTQRHTHTRCLLLLLLLPLPLLLLLLLLLLLRP
jgi:hypothetical protein